MRQRKKVEERVYPIKRPLYIVGFCFGGALLAAAVGGFHLACMAVGLSALLLSLVLSIGAVRKYHGLVAALLAAAAAFSVFAVREYVTVWPLQQQHGTQKELTLWLEEEATVSDDTVAYYVRVRAGDLPENTRLILWFQNGENTPELYNQVKGTVSLRATDDYRREGVYLTGWLDKGKVMISDERPWNLPLILWRQTVLQKLEQKADGDVAALLRAICFGDKSLLSDTVRENFADAGLSHLAAVSGFHMSTVCLGLFGLLCFLGVRRRPAAGLALPTPLLFAALTGFSYSALRAGAMCVLLLLGMMLRRKSDARNSLGGAVLLILICDMAAIYDLGFQLSVVATWGILVAAGWGAMPTAETRWQKCKAALWAAMRVTLAAIMATLPILALEFGELATLSPLTNLLAQPAASVIVTAGALGGLLLAVPGLAFLASPFILLAGVMARFLLWLAEFVSTLPFAVMLLDRPYLTLLACAAPFVLVLGWRLLKGRGVRLTAILLIITLLAATLTYNLGMRGVTVVTAADASKGSVVLLTRDGHHALILLGEHTVGDVQHFLSKRGIDRLDFVLYTNEEKTAITIKAETKTLTMNGESVLSTDERFAFWDTNAVSVRENWLLLHVAGSQVLLCTKPGDVAALDEREREAALAVFDRVLPAGVENLALGQAVLCSDAEKIHTVPVGYTVSITGNETVTVKMRGSGHAVE